MAKVRTRVDVINDESRDEGTRVENGVVRLMGSAALLENRARLPGLRRKVAMIEERGAPRAMRAGERGDQSRSGGVDGMQCIEVIDVAVGSS